MMSFRAVTNRDVKTRDANAEKDVQHGATKAGGEGHDRVPEFGDRDICDEIAKGVTDRKDGEAEDCVAYSEDDAQRFEHADNLVSDGGDPSDCYSKSEEANEGSAFRWVIGRGGRKQDEKTDQGEEEGAKDEPQE